MRNSNVESSWKNDYSKGREISGTATSRRILGKWLLIMAGG
jgi:hypothetical protein